jgi:formylglycine-generating enzyme required for sulfatase activity
MQVSGRDPYDPARPSPQNKYPVGSYVLYPNQWGMYDICGNAHEWVEDKTWINFLLPPDMEGWRMTLGGKATWYPDHTSIHAQMTFSTHRQQPGAIGEAGFRITKPYKIKKQRPIKKK